jgi:hypothetical protein
MFNFPYFIYGMSSESHWLSLHHFSRWWFFATTNQVVINHILTITLTIINHQKNLFVQPLCPSTKGNHRVPVAPCGSGRLGCSLSCLSCSAVGCPWRRSKEGPGHTAGAELENFWGSVCLKMWYSCIVLFFFIYVLIGNLIIIQWSWVYTIFRQSHVNVGEPI